MFEVHITTQAIQETEIDDFKAFCKVIDAKPILIQLPEGVVTQQPMISKLYKDIEPGHLKVEIVHLESLFRDNDYEVVRTKVEVPLEFMEEGKKEFPDYKGQYFEWHGKVFVEDIETLRHALRANDAHISRNALKDEPNKRFVTVRALNYRYGFSGRGFLDKVNIVKRSLEQSGIELVKDEYEYCIYDSNKNVDKGWIDVPEITDHSYLHLLAFEGFLKRMVERKEKFVLKGSIVTRQYFSDKNIRKVQDLDFLYTDPIEDEKEAERIFTDWITAVTETEIDDNTKYRSFSENAFWRAIDYAMDDDFPTTNTDLLCHYKDQRIEYRLDITWNLPLEEAAVPLIYQPEEGEPFTIPYTVPLPTQIAWKLHQSMVRPRMKDYLDIILLLENNILSEDQLETVARVLVHECMKDKIDPLNISYYANGEVSKFLQTKSSFIEFKYLSKNPILTPFGFSVGTDCLKSLIKHVFDHGFAYEDEISAIEAFEKSLAESGVIHKVEAYTKQMIENLAKEKIAKEEEEKRKEEELRSTILLNSTMNEKRNETSFFRKLIRFFSGS